MLHNRITFALAAAAGGLLGGAFLPVAIAVADDAAVDPAAVDPGAYSYLLDGKETLTGLYNMTTAPPGVNESLQGYGLFDAVNSSDTPEGSFYAYDSTAPYLTPLINVNNAIVSSQVLYVDSNVPGGDGTPGFLPDGTVISITHSGGGLFENVYSAIPGSGGGTVSDTLITPFGNVDLSNFVGSLFDANNVTPQLPDGITAVGAPDVNAVNGLPPLTIAEQGIQQLSYNGSDPFTAVETTTTDGIGFHTEAFLVTDGSSDSLPTGSIYNVINFGNLSNVYSSIPQDDGSDKVTDTLINTATHQTTDLTSLFGAYDASKGLLDGTNLHDIAFGDTTISPVTAGTEEFTGINGLPPGNASIQGIDLFNYVNGADSTHFTADVTTIPDMSFSNYSEALLVTATGDPTLLPDGSVIDLTTYGNGWENIYTDLPGLGANSHDLITDTLVNTATGNSLDLSWLYQSIDASAGMDHLVNLIDTSWLTEFFPHAADMLTTWLGSL